MCKSLRILLLSLRDQYFQIKGYASTYGAQFI